MKYRDLTEDRKVEYHYVLDKADKKTVFNSKVKEDTPRSSVDQDFTDSDDDGDGLKDPNVEDSDEIVEVWETDQKGQKKLNRRKTYKLSKVEERVGVKINVASKYYDEDA